jgi:Protein kinase domain
MIAHNCLAGQIPPSFPPGRDCRYGLPGRIDAAGHRARFRGRRVAVVKDLKPGDPPQVGRYRLLGELGSGGMGRVFLGRSPGGRQVAVKVIRSELAGDPDFRARFAREVATARTVSGIFTAPVVDADLDAPQPWLVTAYVEGPSLDDAVREQGPLPAAAVLTLAAGLAEGLGAIHAAGVVHRDLKPSNVLLARDGPRIIDFGISRAADGTALTQAGWVSGSPGFMSPEQAQGGGAGLASDIFSLGAVLTFAATGQEAFGTGSPATLLYRVVHSAPETDRLPVSLRPLLERCLAKDPRQRPTTDQIIAELDTEPPVAGWLTRAVPSAAGQAVPSAAGQAGPLDGPARPPWGRPQAGEGAVSGQRPPAETFADPLPTRVEAAHGEPAGGERAGGEPARGEPADRMRSHRMRPRGESARGRPTRRKPAPERWTRGDRAAIGSARSRDRPPGSGRLAAPLAWAAGTLAVAVVGAIALLAVHGLGAAHSGAAAASRSPAPASPAQAAWDRYQDPSGFSVRLPASWRLRARTANQVTFTGPPAGFALVIAWTTNPHGDQLADWRQQAASRARTDPTYQQLSIRRVSYRGYDAADWAFTNSYRSRIVHVLDRGFIVAPGRLAYAIELYGPQARWPAVYARMWGPLTRSFAPAAG